MLRTVFMVKDVNPTLVAFYDSKVDNQHKVDEVQRMFRAVVQARKISPYTNEFDSGVVDVSQYAKYAKKLGVDLDHLPQIVMVHKDLARIFVYNGPLSGSSISDWVSKFFDHKLKPTPRSGVVDEEVEKANRGVVTEVCIFHIVVLTLSLSLSLSHSHT